MRWPPHRVLLGYHVEEESQFEPYRVGARAWTKGSRKWYGRAMNRSRLKVVPPDPPAEPIERLALSFPTLRGAGGVSPWNPRELDGWACGPVPGHGAKHAARFVLAVWNNDAEWQCGKFDVVEALPVWDDSHRAVFLAWCAQPWWA
jgi:hypothetical protein